MAPQDLSVGFVSDAHGCALALDLGVRRLYDLHGVDAIVCLGDVASFGPEPNQCVAYLRDERIPTVRGNSDDEMLRRAVLLPDASPRARQIESVIEWSRRTLTTEAKEWLAALPASHAIDDLLCVHATADSNTEIATRHDRRRVPSGVSIVVAGHLHTPFVDRQHDGTWVNAGSVSRPTDGDPRGSVAIVSRVDGTWNASIDRFELPIDDMCERARRSGIPHSDRWCETLRNACWW